MRLMHSNTILAESKIIGGVPYMVVCPGVDRRLLPFMLFGDDDKITSFKFAKWAKKRCFPPERMDAAKLLAEMGLDHYDAWEIIKQTNARLTCIDEFWVDFKNQYWRISTTTEEYDKLRRLKSWNYGLVVDEVYANNLQKIHPLKQVQVNKLCSLAKDYAVNRIIVFGSATRWDCHNLSDLDLCVDWQCCVYDDNYVYTEEVTRFRKIISKVTMGNCDVIDFQYLDDTIVSDAVREGIVVYERFIQQVQGLV